MDKVKAYLMNHWEGVFPLWQSFWVNSFLLPIAIYIPLLSLLFTTGPDGVPTANLFGLVLFSLVSAVVGIWATVGLWLCTKRIRSDAEAKKSWATIVQVLIIIMLVISVLNILATMNIISGIATGYILYRLVQAGR